VDAVPFVRLGRFRYCVINDDLSVHAQEAANGPLSPVGNNRQEDEVWGEGDRDVVGRARKSSGMLLYHFLYG
jgi:hypothetical protein